MSRPQYTKVARKRKPNRWHRMSAHLRPLYWAFHYSGSWLPPRRKRTGLTLAMMEKFAAELKPDQPLTLTMSIETANRLKSL